ncbi:MAG: hypothetical protein PHU25_09335 [Deltaproteobacteria bacterium]|nr:hypothetical protein [Deltaproteobacteria bacterium]
MRKATHILSAIACLVALSIPGCGGDDDSATDTGTEADGGLDAGDTDTGLDIAVCAPENGPFSLAIDNEFFPMVVGAQRVLDGEEDGAAIHLEITVLDETQDVAGVTTRVLEEKESEDGVLLEISRNFFVQAPDGTVCYYGEDVDIYDADGGVVDHAGAWRAGVDGALPGIQVPAAPEVGMEYDQEYAPDVAQDHGEITAMGEHLSVPAGEFDDTLEVTETSPFETGSSIKIYVKGIGMVVDGTVVLQSY